MRKVFLALASLVLGSGLVVGGTGAHAQVLGIGTAPPATAGYGIGSAIAKVLSDTEKVQSRIQPHSGTSAYLPLLNSGEIDFGIANILETVEAANGQGPFKGKKLENLRAVAILYPFKSVFIVKKDSPIKTIPDLKGKSMPYGFTAQVTLNTLVDAMLANGGLTSKDIQPNMVPNVVRGADDFAAGKTDAFFFALGAGKITEVDAAVGGVRALGISDAPAALAAMKKVFSYAYVITENPRPGLAGVLEPTKLMAYDYVLLVGKHVSDATVNQVTRIMAANPQALTAAFAPFREFSPEKMAKDMPVPYHPGAVKYYQDKKMWPPKA